MINKVLRKTYPEAMEDFSCSVQLSMKLVLLMNICHIHIYGQDESNSFNDSNLNSSDIDYFDIYEQYKFHAQLS